MKNIIFVSCVFLFSLIGCRKEKTISPGSTIPFENDNIKLELITSSTPSSLRDIHFMNASTGIAISYDGKIYKTTNSGVSWTLQYSNLIPNQPFLQTFFTDANIGYVVGGSNSCGGTGCIPPGGLILKTSDGGNNWATILQKPNDTFVSISSNNTGDLFAISNGIKRTISKSNDAGLNWSAVDSVDFDLGKITFINNFGFCTGDDGKIIRSDDNGLTWTLLATESALYSTDIKFNNGNGFYISNNRTIHKTDDNGNNWKQILQPNYSSYILNPLTTNSCLVFGGRDYVHNAALAQTTNAGNSWVETEFTNIDPIRYSSFYSSTEGYVIAGSNLIKVTVK
jgi:photosystem II stability/assembly factor-like uncharacterized protein